jgi:hypothetical protein
MGQKTWTPDDESDRCAICDELFTFLNRRHHVRCDSLFAWGWRMLTGVLHIAIVSTLLESRVRRVFALLHAAASVLAGV